MRFHPPFKVDDARIIEGTSKTLDTYFIPIVDTTGKEACRVYVGWNEKEIQEAIINASILVDRLNGKGY